MFIKFDRRVNSFKKAENINHVKLSSAYDHNCSEQQFAEINDEVLECTKSGDRREATLNRRDRRHVTCYEDLHQIKTPDIVLRQNPFYSQLSAESDLSKIKRIFEALTDKQRIRVYMHIELEMTYTEIAEREEKSTCAVYESCILAYAKLRKYGDFLRECVEQSWIDLLVPENAGTVEIDLIKAEERELAA